MINILHSLGYGIGAYVLMQYIVMIFIKGIGGTIELKEGVDSEWLTMLIIKHPVVIALSIFLITL
jgi:hypothetical protein